MKKNIKNDSVIRAIASATAGMLAITTAVGSIPMQVFAEEAPIENPADDEKPAEIPAPPTAETKDTSSDFTQAASDAQESLVNAAIKEAVVMVIDIPAAVVDTDKAVDIAKSEADAIKDEADAVKDVNDIKAAEKKDAEKIASDVKDAEDARKAADEAKDNAEKAYETAADKAKEANEANKEAQAATTSGAAKAAADKAGTAAADAEEAAKEALSEAEKAEAEYKKAVDAYVQAVADAEAAVKELNGMIDAADTLDSHKAAAEAEAALKKAEELKAEMISKRKAAEGVVDEKELALVTAQGELAKATQDLIDAGKEEGEAIVLTATTGVLLAEANKAVKDAEEALADANTTVEEKQQAIADMKAAKAAAEEEVARLDDELKALKNEKAGASKELEAKKKALESAKAVVKSTGEALKIAEGKVTDIIGKIADETTKLTELTDEDYEKAVYALEQKIADETKREEGETADSLRDDLVKTVIANSELGKDAKTIEVVSKALDAGDESKGTVDLFVVTAEDGSTKYYAYETNDANQIMVYEYSYGTYTAIVVKDYETTTVAPEALENKKKEGETADGELPDYKVIRHTEHQDAVAPVEAEYTVTYEELVEHKKGETIDKKADGTRITGADIINGTFKVPEGTQVRAEDWAGITHYYKLENGKWMCYWNEKCTVKVLSGGIAGEQTSLNAGDTVWLVYTAKTTVAETKTVKDVKSSALSLYEGKTGFSKTETKQAVAGKDEVPESYEVIFYEFEDKVTYAKTDADVDASQDNITAQVVAQQGVVNGLETQKKQLVEDAGKAQTAKNEADAALKTAEGDVETAQKAYDDADKAVKDAEKAKNDAESAYKKYYKNAFGGELGSQYQSDLLKANGEWLAAIAVREGKEAELELKKGLRDIAKAAHEAAVKDLADKTEKLLAAVVNEAGAVVKVGGAVIDLEDARAKLEVAKKAEKDAETLRAAAEDAYDAAVEADKKVEDLKKLTGGLYTDELRKAYEELEAAKKAYEDAKKAAEDAEEEAKKAKEEYEEALKKVQELIDEERRRAEEEDGVAPGVVVDSTAIAVALPAAAAPAAVLGVNREYNEEAAADGAVLGARRNNGGAVLGARRDAATGDTNNFGMYVAMVGAAAFAGAGYVALRRREEEEA